jgi:GTP-binding protein YchF
MRIALIGWQGGGKSTLFTAVTGSQAAIGEEAHPGTALVPDDVLDRLHELYPPAKKINARVEYLDIAGLAASQKKSGFKRSMINHLQGSEVLAAVIGVFHLGPKPVEEIAGAVHSDIADLETEMLLSDMQIAESRLEKISQSRQRGLKVDAIEEGALQKALTALNEETPLRNVEFSGQEELALRTYSFLSQKALLIVVNHGEEQDGSELKGALSDLSSTRRRVEVLNAQLEAEIATLDEDDRGPFLEDLGIESPAADRVINAGFSLLGLLRFFTVGDDEVRAWPIPEGMVAVDAAGEIHSDLARGFIRAEVVHSDDLLRLGSLAKCRDEGVLRLEGKQYVVRDGDVMHIRFAV